MKSFYILFLILNIFIYSSLCIVHNIEKLGIIPNNDDISIMTHNTKLFNETLANLKPNDILYVPNTTFWFMGGIYGSDISDVIILIDGTIKYSDNEKLWPRDDDGKVKECMYLERLNNVTFTSNNKGTFDGNGKRWWGAISYLRIQENRPRLLKVYNSSNLLIEYILFKNSPYWTTYFIDVSDLVIRYSDVDARRTDLDWHGPLDIVAFNTDGFDVAGKNIHIHDCNIWNDDDCIAVKQLPDVSYQAECSENMLFENINASGLGLTIGSIGPHTIPSCVRNITFRNSKMHNTVKGLYLKSRPGSDGETGEISDILYENIEIFNASQWAIWIGPQQAGYENACGLTWPFNPRSECPVPAGITWNNLIFRNITIDQPKFSPGVILGNSTNPMNNIIFDNVIVKNSGMIPWGTDYYICENTIGYATGNTYPIPPCFKEI